MQKEANKVGRLVGSRVVLGKGGGSLTIVPRNTPHFIPHRVRMTVIDPKNPGREVDFKIGSVFISGSPQLPHQSRNLNDDSEGLRVCDINRSNSHRCDWSVIRGGSYDPGVSISYYNPNDFPVHWFVTIEGEPIESIPCESISERSATCESVSKAILDGDPIPSKDILLRPGEEGLLTVSHPYSTKISPECMRVRGRISETGEIVPITITEYFCDGIPQLNIVSMIDVIRSKSGSDLRSASDKDILGELMRRLNSKGSSPNEEEPMPQSLSGVISTHLEDISGVIALQHCPLASCDRLGGGFSALVGNPWSRDIHANISLTGKAL